METNALISELLSLYLTPIISKHFAIKGISKSISRIDIRLEEFPELIPVVLQHWYKEIQIADVDEMLNFKSSVERNQLDIINYFSQGHTNAISENINARIQQFISANKGTRDINFCYFKIKKIFASTSK